MNPFDGPIELRLRRSRWLMAYLIVIYAGAAAVVAWVDLSWVVKFVLLVFIAYSARRTYGRYALFRRDAVVGLLSRPDGGWVVTLADGAVTSAALLPGYLVTPTLTVLVFRLENGKRSTVVMTPDNTDANPFRRLRVRLRYGMER